MGWHLAGLELARGHADHAPVPSPSGLAKARAGAERVARRFGLLWISHRTLAQFEAEAGQRTLYRFDVRTPEEYQASHPIGWRSAPGGQLVQATDFYVGTLKSRLVLADSDGVRALLTASWLRQLGWEEVYVYQGSVQDQPQTSGSEPLDVPGGIPDAETIDVPTLVRLLTAHEAVVIDLATSLDYRAGHIPGAWFAIRARFAESVGRLPEIGDLVLTSPDGVLARLAAADLEAVTDRKVLVLAGGTEAWRAAGQLLSQGIEDEHQLDPPEDAWYRPYDQNQGVEAAMREYLRWELDLPAQIARDGDARFRVRAP
jgi:rhodanese-related sulfurtransferase